MIRPYLAFVGLAGLLVLAGGTGCRSSGEKKPRSSSTAAVAIRGRTTEQIHATARAVFQEHLYQLVSSAPNHLVLERRGSRMKEIAYGGWLNSEVWIRVKLTLTQFGSSAHLLECDAYAVRDHGDSFFEDEQKIAKINRRPYRKILEEIQKRLEGPDTP